jgi:hypothetical protein
MSERSSQSTAIRTNFAVAHDGINSLFGRCESLLGEARKTDGDKAFDRFTGKRDGTLWYYCPLVSEFRKHLGSNPELIDEFDRVVSEIEKLTIR